jgi:CDP-diacylglycerol--serine O-phosphatidyltransferase
MAALKPRRTRSTATPPRAFRRNKSAQDIGVLETRRAKRQQFLRKRGIYLLPNAFTTAALFCGFFAVVQAMNVRFEIAAIAIFVAMVLDGMDGGRWGWLAAFVYCSGAALRLARFNTNVGVVDKRYFQGLPSPAAAALIAGFVWLATDNRVPLKLVWLPWVAFALTIYAGVTMVSNAPFYSGKALDVRFRVPFAGVLLVVVAFVLVSSDPPLMLFGLFVLYGFSGYAWWGYMAMRGRPNPARSSEKAH